MVKIEEEMKRLNLGDYGERLVDYFGSLYICDTIMEIADSEVSIYTSDLFDWVAEGNNYEYCEDAVKNGLCDGTDFIAMLRCGQYFSIENDLYSHLDDLLINYAYNWLIASEIYEIPEDMDDEICSMHFDHNDKLEDIEDFVNNLIEEYINNEDDEDEEE